MGFLDRVSQLMTSDIDLLLDGAGDPEHAIGQLIGDMEASIVDLRRVTVNAVARQNRLRKQLFAAEGAASRIECEATMALDRGEERRARQVVAREIGVLKARDACARELEDADRLSARLVANLVRMEDRVQVARRKRAEIVRRQRAVETVTPAPATGSGAFAAYAQAVGALEVEAEVTRERCASPAGSGCCLAKVDGDLEGGGRC
jgi:phage shock protein A